MVNGTTTQTKSQGQIEKEKARILDIEREAILSGGSFSKEDLVFLRSVHGTLDDPNFDRLIDEMLGP